MKGQAYIPMKDHLLARGGQRYHNRPMYGDNRPSVVLAGDRPQLKWIEGTAVCGYSLAAAVREGATLRLDDFAEVTTRFYPGRTEWELEDAAFPGLLLRLSAVPLAEREGFAVWLSADGQREGDGIVWAFGGAADRESGMVMWDNDPSENRHLTERGFQPDDCLGNRVTLEGAAFELRSPAPADRVIRGACSLGEGLRIADAREWAEARIRDGAAEIVWGVELEAADRSPEQGASGGLTETGGDGQAATIDEPEVTGEPERPIACGSCPIPASGEAVYWGVETLNGLRNPVQPGELAEHYNAGVARAEQIARRISVDTPDEELNAGVPFVTAALEGMYYPPRFMHGAMSWNMPFLGWRSRYGPTAFGYGDRVAKEGLFYLPHQRTEQPPADFRPADYYLRHKTADADLRFFGKGHIMLDSHMYNMQEVYFDQLIHAWRWTGDPELERALRPALELHLEWQRECFDPEGRGTYESSINVWASDGIWYNGGETAQATAYAYAGYKAAAELARRAGDEDSALRHEERLAAIRERLIESLWIPERGYLAEYRDVIGHRRRHDDASAYTIVLPIDAGLMSPLEAAQMVRYTEWGLQRTPVDGGGELCWLTNFVPYDWSVRELSFADNLHLALSYYQAGLGSEGWKLLQATVRESMYRSIVPGGVTIEPVFHTRGKPPQQEGRATDFSDTTSMLARVLIEGMYGFRPDYANGMVLLAPQFPEEWAHASVETPEFSLSFRRENDVDRYEIRLTRPAAMTLKVPARAERVEAVLVGGRQAAFRCEPGFGEPLVSVELGGISQTLAEIKVVLAERRPAARPVALDAEAGADAALTSAHGRIVAAEDPQRVLAEPISLAADGSTRAVIRAEAEGYHSIWALVEQGSLGYWQAFHLHVRNAGKEAAAAARQAVVARDAEWTFPDLSTAYNGDVREVYRQRYVTPEAPSSALTIGPDGYSPWTYPYWNKQAPDIGLERVSAITDEAGLLWTANAVPFRLGDTGEVSVFEKTGDPGAASGDTAADASALSPCRNIAFTSLWSNWPTRVTVPVEGSGRVVWLLVAGTTNVMQTQIANAVITVGYRDGGCETLELFHPDNYRSLSEEYDDGLDGFALRTAPQTVELGTHCRAVAVGIPVDPAKPIASVKLECLSQDVVVGIMGITLMV